MHRQPPPTRGSRVIDPLTGRVGNAPDEWSETQRHSVFTGALQHTRDAVDALGHRFPVSVLRLTIGLPSEAAMYRGGRGTARHGFATRLPEALPQGQQRGSEFTTPKADLSGGPMAYSRPSSTARPV